jgi:hypothetical protein
MDLDLNSDEKALVDRLERFLPGLADASLGDGPDPTRVIHSLVKEGFLSVGNEGAQGLVKAMLVTHVVSKAYGNAPVGVHALLAPALFYETTESLIAVKRTDRPVPVRFAEAAEFLIEVGPEHSHGYRLAPGAAKPVKTNFGYPYGDLSSVMSGDPIGVWPSNLVERRWRLALVGEIVGTMAGALERLVSYLSGRRQFGRAIGSFQGLQHRVAELSVNLECARYLSLHAAWTDTDAAAASAAVYAANAAHVMCLEAHQLSGAQGFTIESGLYRWTLRLQALSVEAGGAEAHSAAAAASIWQMSGVKP